VDKGSKVMTYASEKLEEENAHRDERHLYRRASYISMTILHSPFAYLLRKIIKREQLKETHRKVRSSRWKKNSETRKAEFSKAEIMHVQPDKTNKSEHPIRFQILSRATKQCCLNSAKFYFSKRKRIKNSMICILHLVSPSRVVSILSCISETKASRIWIF